MNDADNSFPELALLLAQRLAVVSKLAASLEACRPALFGHDAEAIARGAAHQAELCREWSQLEDRLRAAAAHHPARLSGTACAGTDSMSFNSADFDFADSASAQSASVSSDSTDPDQQRSTDLAADWQALARRIRYLTRVHSSLLRHVQRSLGILQRVVDSCAPTYLPAPGWNEPRLDVRAGE
ncbi:MAG: hypothetical protein WA618_11785 [Terriglobales bacterium]